MAGNHDIVPDGVASNRVQPSPNNSQGAKECSICYQPMTSEENRTPRLLNCGHTFCTECLQSIFNVAGSEYPYHRRMEILCPHCKTPCNVPDGDVMKFPKNYALLEIISEQPKMKTNPENIVCKTHNIVKKSYCFNCQDLVCPYCQMINHQAHNCQITIEAIKVFLGDFQQNLERLEAYSQQLKSAKDKFQATLYRLKENQREASHHINVRFTAIIDEAQKWKNINIRKLDDITKEREEILDQQIETLNDVIDDTGKKIELAKRITTPQNEEEFFIHHKNIVSETQVLVSKEMGLQPLVHEHIEWRVDPINHIIDLLNRIAFVNEDANAAPAKSPPPSIDPQPASSSAESGYMRSVPPQPSQPQPPQPPHAQLSAYGTNRSGIPPPIQSHPSQHLPSQSPPMPAVHSNQLQMPMHGQVQHPYNQYAEGNSYPESIRGKRMNPGMASKLTPTQHSHASGYTQEGPLSLSEHLNSELPPPIHRTVHNMAVHGSTLRNDSSVNPAPFPQQQTQPLEIYDNLPYQKPLDGSMH